jgi:hypothetical protein
MRYEPEALIIEVLDEGPGIPVDDLPTFSRISFVPAM